MTYLERTTNRRRLLHVDGTCGGSGGGVRRDSTGVGGSGARDSVEGEEAGKEW